MTIRRYTLDISYDQYCAALASMQGQEVAIALPGPLLKWIGEAKELFQQIANDVGLAVKDVIDLFRQKDLFLLLKGVGFSLAKIGKALGKVPTLITRGLLITMHEIAKSNLVKELQAGTVKIDEILNKYPILKQLAGPALAGLLLYIWLNMSFVGDLEFDMDISVVVDAFRGVFSLHDLFVSPEGLTMLALFTAGTFTGIGVAWLGDTTLNLLTALLYTAAIHLHKTGIAVKLKPLIERKRYNL